MRWCPNCTDMDGLSISFTLLGGSNIGVGSGGGSGGGSGIIVDFDADFGESDGGAQQVD